MKIIHTKDYYHMSRVAANVISAQIIMKSNCVLGLATGSSPIGVYSQLIEWYRKGDLDLSSVTTLNLDEYRGISPDNPQSYHYYMNQHFFSQTNIDLTRTHLPDGTGAAPEDVCANYNAILQKVGGIDIQLLGIGHNGHIGFNEPGASFEKETHLVDLTPSTIEANSRFFTDPKDVPTQAYTMGIKSIMHAKKILVVANGESKADIIKEAFFGPVTPSVPASILQLHPDVTIIGDILALQKVGDCL